MTFGLTEPPKKAITKNPWGGWLVALRDWRLQVYVCFNLFFTSFVIQIETTLPLFFKNFIRYQNEVGLPYTLITWLFAEYIGIMALIQMPAARRFGSSKRTRVLMVSTLLMFAGFVSVWLSTAQDSILVVAASMVAMLFFALSVVLYGPAASALVAEIAPPESRGVYLSVNSICWAAGAAIGAPIGLAALELPGHHGAHLWLALSACALVALGMMRILDSRIDSKK